MTIHNPVEEPRGSMPFYYPGDIFQARDGSVGIITNAHVVIHGGNVSWNDPHRMPKVVDQDRCGEPCYSADRVPGFPISKNAWWYAAEWVRVAHGPLHELLDGKPSAHFLK